MQRELENIAASIFEKHELDFQNAKRLGGWTNAVWANGSMVLRLSANQNTGKIGREALLSKLFPEAVGYPLVIDTGVIDGHEWSLSEKVADYNLSDIWPKLDWPERTLAAQRLWAIVTAVHSVKVSEAEALSSPKPWYSDLDPEKIFSRMDFYRDNNIFDSVQTKRLSQLLENFFACLETAPKVLNHGDITCDNILYKQDKTLALIDFEHSVIAPAELDLNSYLNLCFFSETDNYSDCGGREDFTKGVLSLVKPSMSASAYDLLFGFSIIFQQRFLEFWLENPEGDISLLEAYQKLLSFTETTGGYFAGITNFI